MKVLVIEDEPKLADYLRKALSESSYVVDVANDGATGLHFAREGQYDLIVLDVMLPVVDGFGVPKMVIGYSKRQSFLVKDGLIVWSDPDVSPATHTAKVLEAAAKLK